MAFSAQTQGLDTLNQLEGTEWVQGASQITEDFDSEADGKSNWAKCVPKLESVVSRRFLNHIWESLAVLAPIKLS